MFENNGTIPSRYTCDGRDINPPFDITGVPARTKSLILIMDDPDAVFGTWVHWVVSNINPKISKIEEGETPKEAIECRTSFGQPGYGGPCPPGGTHHYFFKLYALGTKLNITSVETKEGIEKLMKGHILAQAEIVGLYSREG